MAAEGLGKVGSASVTRIFFSLLCMNLRGLDKVERLGVRRMPRLGWKREGVGIELWSASSQQCKEWKGPD